MPSTRNVDPEVSRLRGRICGLSKAKASPDVLDAARAELAAASMRVYITKALDKAPPLTDHQRAKLSELLRPVRVGGGNAGD